jgi:hypothetical protein
MPILFVQGLRNCTGTHTSPKGLVAPASFLEAVASNRGENKHER